MSPQTPKRSQITSPCPWGSRTKLTSTKRLHPGPAPRSQDVLAAGTPAEHQQDRGCWSVEREASGTTPGGKVGASVSPSPAHRSMPKNRPPGFCFSRGAERSPCSGCRGELLRPRPPPPMPAQGRGRAATAAWLEPALKPPAVPPRTHGTLPLRDAALLQGSESHRGRRRASAASTRGRTRSSNAARLQEADTNPRKKRKGVPGRAPRGARCRGACSPVPSSRGAGRAARPASESREHGEAGAAGCAATAASSSEDVDLEKRSLRQDA